MKTTYKSKKTKTTEDIPCFLRDGSRREDPTRIRRSDGLCVTKSCNANSLLNPETGECIPKNSTKGRKLNNIRNINDLFSDDSLRKIQDNRFKQSRSTAKRVSRKKSSTKTPSTKTPSTKTPSTKKPSTKTPSTKTPSTKTPSTKTPSTKTPSTKTPSTKTPSTKTPSTKTPNSISSRTPSFNLSFLQSPSPPVNPSPFHTPVNPSQFHTPMNPSPSPYPYPSPSPSSLENPSPSVNPSPSSVNPSPRIPSIIRNFGDVNIYNNNGGIFDNNNKNLFSLHSGGSSVLEIYDVPDIIRGIKFSS